MNADDIAQAVAASLADRVETGVRSLPAPAEGAVARALVCVRRPGRPGLGDGWRVVAVAGQDDVVVFSPAPVPALVGVQGTPTALIHRASAALAPLVAGDALDVHEVTALDAAYAALDVLGALAPDAWSTLLYGIWDAVDARRERGSGVSVWFHGDEDWQGIVWAAQLARGVELTGPAEGFDRPRPTWTCVTGADLAPALSALVPVVARALVARNLFAARTPTAAGVAETLRQAIRAAKAARGRLRVDTRGSFPDTRPSATLWRIDDLGEHHVLEVAETAAGITVDGAPFTGESDVAGIVAAVAADRDRLTADKLVPGATYRVLRPFLGHPAGAEVRFRAAEHVPREGLTIYRFDGFQLDEWTDAHLEVLRRLDAYLALSRS